MTLEIIYWKYLLSTTLCLGTVWALLRWIVVPWIQKKSMRTTRISILDKHPVGPGKMLMIVRFENYKCAIGITQSHIDLLFMLTSDSEPRPVDRSE